MRGALKPWHAVATPHEDIRAGRLEEAVFAASLWAVVQGSAPRVYLDPEEFYGKTYMTMGLGTALSRVSAALQGGEAVRWPGSTRWEPDRSSWICRSRARLLRI